MAEPQIRHPADGVMVGKGPGGQKNRLIPASGNPGRRDVDYSRLALGTRAVCHGDNRGLGGDEAKHVQQPRPPTQVHGHCAI